MPPPGRCRGQVGRPAGPPLARGAGPFAGPHSPPDGRVYLPARSARPVLPPPSGAPTSAAGLLRESRASRALASLIRDMTASRRGRLLLRIGEEAQDANL